MTNERPHRPGDRQPEGDGARIEESIRRELWALLVLYAALTVTPLLFGALLL